MFTLLRSLFISLVILPLLSKIGRKLFIIGALGIIGYFGFEWFVSQGAGK